jgi:hypothetical protein
MADTDDPRARAITSGVARDRRQAATGSAGPCRLSRYPTRTPPAVSGHLHTHTRRTARPSGSVSAGQGQV